MGAPIEEAAGRDRCRRGGGGAPKRTPRGHGRSGKWCRDRRRDRRQRTRTDANEGPGQRRWTTPTPARSSSTTRCFGLDPAARHPCTGDGSTGSLPSGAPATHKDQRTVSEVSGTGKKPVRQKGTGPCPPGYGAGAAHARWCRRARPRCRATMASTCRRRSASWRSGMPCRPRRGTATLIVPGKARRRRNHKTRELAAPAEDVGESASALVGRRRGALTPSFALASPQPAAGRPAASAGRQRLRHPAPRDAGPDPGCGRQSFRSA